MAKKPRPPRQQLIEAGKVARDMLVDKKIIAKDSLIDQILNDRRSPILPGIPAYLPHVDAIKGSQRILRDLLVMWIKDPLNKERPARADDIAAFTGFVHEELGKLVHEYNQQIVNQPKLIQSLQTVPVLRDVFMPLRNKQVVRVMHRFLIDSLAVAVIVKQNHTVIEYLDWFAHWTRELEYLWIPPEKRNQKVL